MIAEFCLEHIYGTYTVIACVMAGLIGLAYSTFEGK